MRVSAVTDTDKRMTTVSRQSHFTVRRFDDDRSRAVSNDTDPGMLVSLHVLRLDTDADFALRAVHADGCVTVRADFQMHITVCGVEAVWPFALEWSLHRDFPIGCLDYR